METASNQSTPPILGKDHPLQKFVTPKYVNDVKRATGGDPEKMRRTSIAIFREGLEQVDDELTMTGFQVEFAKLGSMRMHYRADIGDLIALCKKHGVTPHLGGQMTEFAIENGLSSKKIAEALEAMDLDTVEISNSGADISQRTLDKKIRELSKDFTVIVEVGDKRGSANSFKDMEVDMKRALESDASRVVIEGGGCGNCFVYDQSGAVKSLLLPHLISIAEKMGLKDKVSVEAPNDHQFKYVLFSEGWDQRIANIAPRDLDHVFETRVDATDPDVIRRISKTQGKLHKLIADIIEHCRTCPDHDIDDVINFSIGGFDPSNLDHHKSILNQIVKHQNAPRRMAMRSWFS